MKYRKLGRTAVDVGVVGLGAEHLEHVSREVVASVVNVAIDLGVNYIDLFMASPGVRDNFGVVLKGKRQSVMIAGHLGAAFKDGQYYKTRDLTICENFFNDLLTRLKTDYIDVLMLHYVDEKDDCKKVFGPGELFELGLRLKKEGKARFLGMSTHRVPSAMTAVNTGQIDVIMFSVNPAFDMLSGDMQIDNFRKEETYNQLGSTKDDSVLQRRDLYHACAARGVGVVAMKAYGAGLLFDKENPSSIVLTPVQCINYALSQPGICTVAAGCKNVEEMKAALAFLKATKEEKDYSSINTGAMWKLRGSCMYCNHCLPCPVSIDIGRTTRLADTVRYGINNEIRAEYEALPAKASACIECGNCVERCPFGVDAIANMSRAAGLFGE